MRYFHLQELTYEKYNQWQFNQMLGRLANEHQVIYTNITCRTVLVRKQIVSPALHSEEWRICPHSGGEENYWVFADFEEALAQWRQRNLSTTQYGLYRYTTTREKYEEIRGET